MLLSHVMCDNLLVTRGSKGMTLFKKNGKISSFPSVAGKRARDISGAGDTAIGAFALSLAAGASLEQAMAIASHAAGIVITKVGTAVTTIQEVEQSIRDYNAKKQN
jgi:bifunctional ADP-heptose synthase (sugar kinase/adenylyltransferase)